MVSHPRDGVFASPLRAPGGYTGFGFGRRGTCTSGPTSTPGGCWSSVILVLASVRRNLVRVVTKTVPILGSENGPEFGTVFRPKFWGRFPTPILGSENGPRFWVGKRPHIINLTVGSFSDPKSRPVFRHQNRGRKTSPKFGSESGPKFRPVFRPQNRYRFCYHANQFSASRFQNRGRFPTPKVHRASRNIDARTVTVLAPARAMSTPRNLDSRSISRRRSRDISQRCVRMCALERTP